MRYGNCISHKEHDKIKILKDIGFDYVETGLSGLYVSSDQEIADFIGVLKANNMTCEAVNVFFPGELSLAGENADLARVRDYVNEVCEKTKNIGIKVAVFGSGRSRYCPDGFDKQRAVEQIIEVTGGILAPAAEKYNFIIAVEELNKSETNTINSISEAEYIAAELNHKNIKVLADIYHIAKENDTLESLKDYSLLAHCHISSVSRKYPLPEIESFDALSDFFDTLKKIGYNERMSIEAGLGGYEAAENSAGIPDWVSEADRAFYAESSLALKYMKRLYG